MPPFGVTIPATVPQRSEIPEGLMNYRVHFSSYLAQFCLEPKLFKTKFLEKIEAHNLCSTTFFENRAVYVTMWENIVEREKVTGDSNGA
jgi:hypothetical protein